MICVHPAFPTPSHPAPAPCPRPQASVAVEGRKERVLEGAVLRRLAQVVVHLPGGREDALNAGRREGRRRYCLAILASLGHVDSLSFQYASRFVRFQSRSRIERAARRALPRAAALRRQRLRGRARLYCLLPPAHAEVLALAAVAALPIAAKWPVEQLWGTVVHREMYLQSTINWQLQPGNCKKNNWLLLLIQSGTW